jgi:hypothetical protein
MEQQIVQHAAKPAAQALQLRLYILGGWYSSMIAQQEPDLFEAMHPSNFWAWL